MDWQEHIKARLQANVQSLNHLTEEQKEALVAAELEAAVQATENGLPFGAVVDAPAQPDEEPETEQGVKAGAQGRNKLARKSWRAPAVAPPAPAPPTPMSFVRSLVRWTRFYKLFKD